MARSTCLLISLLPLVLCSSALAPGQHTLGTGTSLAVEDHARAFLMSPDATFSCGFRQAGENAFSFSVWYADAAEKTAVWTAGPGYLRVPADAQMLVRARYEMDDCRDWGKGCRPMFAVPNFSRGAPEQRFKFVRMQHTDFYGYNLGYSTSVTFEYCKKICLDMCLCSAFLYRLEGQGVCYPKFLLFKGYRASAFPGSIL